MYAYGANNPIKYTDPDGNNICAAAANPSFWSGIGIILATLVEDVVTWGAGIADDSVTLGLGLTLIAGALSLSNTNSKAIELSKAQDRTNPQLLYRAVDQRELDSIITNGGKFSMGDSSTYESGKLFQTELTDAYAYARLANPTIAKDNPYVAVVATSDPFKSGIPIDTIIDAPSAVIVPAEKLPLLTPAVILPLED